MNTGWSTILGWSLFTLSVGGSLFVARYQVKNRRRKLEEGSFILSKDLSWEAIVKLEEERLKSLKELNENRNSSNKPTDTTEAK